MEEHASQFADAIFRSEDLRAGSALAVFVSEAASAYARSVSQIEPLSEHDEFWNAMASNIAADWLDEMLSLRAPVIFDSQIDALMSGEPSRPDERELAQQDKERLVDGERHISNLMVLQFVGARLASSGGLEKRLKQLPNSLRHVPLAPHLETQIRSATTLFLLGLERECIVFCAAAVEAALESHNGNQAQPLEETGSGFLYRCINKYLNEQSLNRNCHSLRETRNEHLHPVGRPPKYDRVSALASLVTLVLVLEALAPPPEDPGAFFDRIGRMGD